MEQIVYGNHKIRSGMGMELKQIALERYSANFQAGTCYNGFHSDCCLRGTRVFMVEIQALTIPAKSGFSRIYSDRIDNNRVSRIAAVLEKNLIK